jgi:RNA 2',3'-cyclic 3'-phosphodiesterase
VTTKRLFFGAQIEAAWPPLPSGRLLDPAHRHCTLVFLGNIPWEPLQAQLPHLPLPTFGPLTGHFDRPLFLPPHHPRVAAWHIEWTDPSLLLYQQQLHAFLLTLGYSLDERPFLSHVTLARAPFNQSYWEAAFQPLPCQTSAIHLYETVECLHYQPIWSCDLK